MMDSSRFDRSILVVDDDPDILEVLSFVLIGAGYRVLTASNGAGALEHLRTGPPPSLILLDLMMPGMNAWEFRKQQVQSSALASIPVVVMTGFTRATEEASSIGAVDVITKPIELDVLLTTIARDSAPLAPEQRPASRA
jgi:CheY-like chemotaxis protein